MSRPDNLSVGKKRDGTTDLNKRGRTPELDYSPISVGQGDIEAARGVVAANSVDAQDARNLLEHLGLMPEQTGWCNDGSD